MNSCRVKSNFLAARDFHLTRASEAATMGALMTNHKAAGPRWMRRVVLAVYLTTLTGSLLVISGVFLAPYLRSNPSGHVSAFLYAIYSPLCHQIPDRCFTLRGFPTAVCGRCLGVYIGFVAGLLIFPLIKRPRDLSLPRVLFLFLFTLPLAVDGIAGLLNLWDSPISLRFTTGFLWGTPLPFYFVPGVASAVLEAMGRRHTVFGKNIEKTAAIDVE